MTAPVPAGPTDAQAELREAIARAIHAADEIVDFPGRTWEGDAEDNREDYRRQADVVLALPAVRAAIEAREAVRRVEALAEELEGYAQRRGRPAPGSYDYGVNLAQADAAECIRRALAGEPLTTPGDNGSGDWMGGPIG